MIERLNRGDRPLFVAICTGATAWDKAKKWAASPNGIAALVLPDGESPERFRWTVSGLPVIVDWHPPADSGVVVSLCVELLRCGATTAAVRQNDHQVIRLYHPRRAS